MKKTTHLLFFSIITNIRNYKNYKPQHLLKLFLIVLFLFALSENKLNAQSKKGRWIQRDFTIGWHDSINTILYNYASVESFICNKEGIPSDIGRFLMIKNHSNDTIFYRASPKGLGNYITKKDIEFVSTVSNMIQYYPVIPRQSEIVQIHMYETVHETKQKMSLIIDFKFFQPDSSNKKPTTTISDNMTSKVQINQSKSTIIKIKNNASSSFYIFLTAKLYVHGKFMTIISVPVLHYGMLSDPMINYKENFIKQIENQLPNRPENFKKSLADNNYETISIHYAKPYSTSLLRSLNESIDAIDAFKQSIRYAVEGLPNENLIVFFQLK